MILDDPKAYAEAVSRYEADKAAFEKVLEQWNKRCKDIEDGGATVTGCGCLLWLAAMFFAGVSGLLSGNGGIFAVTFLALCCVVLPIEIGIGKLRLKKFQRLNPQPVFTAVKPEFRPKEERDTREPPISNQELTVEQCLKSLGIQPPTTLVEIKKAYRELIAQYHPDKVAHLGDDLKELAHRKSKELNLAYQKLEIFYRH